MPRVRYTCICAMQVTLMVSISASLYPNWHHNSQVKMPYWFSSGFIWSHMRGIWFQLVPVTPLLVSTGPSCQCSGLLLVSFGPSYCVSGFELVPVVSGLVCYWFHLAPVVGYLIQTGPSCKWPDTHLVSSGPSYQKYCFKFGPSCNGLVC